MAGDSPAASKWWLRIALQRLRLTAGRTRQQMADRLGKADTWPGHIETGRNLPAPSDLEILLAWYSRADLVPLFLEELRKIKRERDWWREYADVLPDSQQLYLGLETASELIEGYAVASIPELLQTADYARALLLDSQQFSGEEIERRVGLLKERQQRMLGDTSTQIHWVINEVVLRRLVGSAKIMGDQIDYLASVCAMPNVSLYILPLATSARPGADGTFTILTLPAKFEGDEVRAVHVESFDGTVYHHEPAKTAVYLATFPQLREAALSPEDTAEFLGQMASHFNS